MLYIVCIIHVLYESFLHTYITFVSFQHNDEDVGISKSQHTFILNIETNLDIY